jgi:hypothetical protein
MGLLVTPVYLLPVICMKSEFMRCGLVWVFAMLSVFTLYRFNVHENGAFTRDHTYKEYIVGAIQHAVRRECNRYNGMATGWEIRGSPSGRR